MFPHVYTSVEEEVIRNLYGYYLALGNTKTLSGLRKRQLCELQRFHELSIARFVKGANGIETCPQAGTVGIVREPSE